MGKYLHVFNIGIQNTLAYRFNFLCRSVLGLIPLARPPSSSGRRYTPAAMENIAGYPLDQMIAYYLVITVDRRLHRGQRGRLADRRRHPGRPHQPVPAQADRLHPLPAGSLRIGPAGLPAGGTGFPIGGFILLHSGSLQLPSSPDTWIFFVISVGLTALLQFFISYSLALLAFWILEIDTFVFIFFAVEYIAGGHVFPLDILPAWMTQALAWTPFPVPALLSRRDLPGADRGSRPGLRTGPAGPLDAPGPGGGPPGLEPGNPQVQCSGRLTGSRAARPWRGQAAPLPLTLRSAVPELDHP